MKLADALTQLDDFDPDEAIFIHPQSRIEPDCEVLVTSYSDDGEPSATTAGMKYLLEVSLVRDALRVWSEWRQGRVPSIEEQIGAVVYYANHDAFQPLDDQASS